MLIKCIHGYFIFKESAPGQLAQILTRFPQANIVSKKDYFTFKTLATAPTYSIKGDNYLGAQATVNFDGEPWDVMRANGLVFNFRLDQVVPIETVTDKINVRQGNNYYLSAGLILPGSFTNKGKRITDYSGWYLFDAAQFKYSELIVE